MRNLFKWLGYVVGLVIVLVVAAGVFLTLAFNPNDYKDAIATAIEKNTGRHVTIEGNIELSVYPWLGIETGRLQLANPRGFGAGPFATITEVGVGVAVLPLLQRKIEVSTIALRGLTVNLVRDRAGRVNWEGPGRPQATVSETPDSPRSAAAKPLPPTGTLADLVVGGLDVGDATVNWDDQATGRRITLNHLNLRTGTVRRAAPFEVVLDMDVTNSKPEISGHVALDAQVQMELDAQRARVNPQLKVALQGDGLPQDFELAFNANIVADGRANTLELNDVVLKILGLEARGTLLGSEVTVAPRLHGHVQIAPFNPRQLLRRLGRQPPRTEDPDALGRASAAFDFLAMADSLEIRQLAAEFDRSKLTGSLQVREFAVPKIGFDLLVDRIDLDAYLAPEAGTSAAAATPAGAAAGAAAQLPLNALRALNLDGSLSMGALKVANLHATDVNVGIAAANGVVDIAPVVARLYQGNYTGTARLDARGDVLQSRVKWELSGVQAGPLLDDLTGHGRLQGVGDVHADLSVTGADTAALRRTLSGDARFSFTDGAVKGFNVAHILRQALAAIEGAAPPPAAVNQTDFSELSGSVRIDAGVVRNDDLHGKSPLLRVDGTGRIDLPQDTVDYTLNAVLVSSLEGQGGKGLNELKGISVPIRITGALAQPRIAPDIEGLINERVKAEVDKQTQKAEQRIERELEEKLGDNLDKETREKLIDQIPGTLKGLFQ